MFPYVLAGCALLAAYLHHRRSYRPTPPTIVGSSGQLSRTTILPRLSSPIPAGHNAIWCISLDLAWRKAMDEVFQGPIQLLEQPPEAELLNQSSATWIGLPDEMVEAGVQVTETQDAEIYRLFSSLVMNMTFEKPFFQTKEPLFFNRYEPVRGFGILPGTTAPKRLRDQVEVLYADGHEFIVDPCRHSGPFQLILATVPAETSLQEAIEATESRCRGYSAHTFGSDYSLLIPEQSWDIRHLFPEFTGKLDRPPFGGEMELEQRVRFRLDRNGAELFSRVDLLVVFLKGRREFYFNYPFLLYIKARKTGQVIFAQWIENEELLVPFSA